MSDYKYEIQVIAEDLAIEEYNTDFYDLDEADQYNVFTKAQEIWSERYFAV